MNIIYSRMKKLLKLFNKHSFTIEDVYRIAKRERINIIFYLMDDKIKGYYQTERKNIYRKKYICLNEKLSKSEILEVLLHELAHHFLHVSAKFSNQTFYCRLAHLNDSKFDAEADAVSLIMEIPEKKLLELMETNFEDITEISHEKLRKRLWLYQHYGE